MKNKIVIFSLILSIVLIICLAVFGIKIGDFKIASVSQIINQNKNVESKIDELTKISETDYNSSANTLDATIKEFKNEKERYQQIAGIDLESSDNSYETQNYDISYLWTTIGKYATKNKLNLAIDVKKASGTDLYNLNFTVQGEYVNISTFITKLENDSDLSFRIYDFKLVPGKSEVELKATFSVKDVNIDNRTLTTNSGVNTNRNEPNSNENNTNNEVSNNTTADIGNNTVQ